MTTPIVDNQLVECPRCIALNIQGCFLCIDSNPPRDGLVPVAMVVEYALLGIAENTTTDAMEPIWDLRKRHGFDAE